MRNFLVTVGKKLPKRLRISHRLLETSQKYEFFSRTCHGICKNREYFHIHATRFRTRCVCLATAPGILPLVAIGQSPMNPSIDGAFESWPLAPSTPAHPSLRVKRFRSSAFLHVVARRRWTMAAFALRGRHQPFDQEQDLGGHLVVHSLGVSQGAVTAAGDDGLEGGDEGTQLCRSVVCGDLVDHFDCNASVLTTTANADASSMALCTSGQRRSPPRSSRESIQTSCPKSPTARWSSRTKPSSCAL